MRAKTPTTAADFNDIVGLGIKDALPLVLERGIEDIRAKVVDGEVKMITMDMRTNRLNVATKGGQITRILGIG